MPLFHLSPNEAVEGVINQCFVLSSNTGAPACRRRVPLSQNFWLSRDHPYAKTKKQKKESIAIGTSDIGSLCYDWFTAVKTRYPLTSLAWQYPGLRSRAHWGLIGYLKLTTDQVLGSRLVRGLEPGYYSGGERGKYVQRQNLGSN